MLEDMESVITIPEGGLSNYPLEKILAIIEKCIPTFVNFGIVTSDFPVCDIQRRFKGESMKIE